MTSPNMKPKTGAERTADYRKRMRAKGLVPRIIWVPDTKDPEFVEEYRRQARAIAQDVEGERDLMAFAEGLSMDVDLGGIPEYRTRDKN